MRSIRRALLVVIATAAALLASAGPASAHGGVVGADLRVAASLGERELTVIIRRVGAVPGPLRVDVVNHADSPGGTLRVAAAPQNNLPGAGNELRLTDGGGSAGTALDVDRIGAWELWVDDGRETARIPFVVPGDVTPAWERVTTGGYTAAGGLLLAALAAAAFGRWSWPPLVLGGGAAAAVVAAVTAGLLSSGLPVEAEIDPATGLPSTARTQAAARPHVDLLADAALVAGQRSPIDLRLVDGGTGRPVDDLVVHHDALVHLVVLGPGGQFAHLHPVRTAPGEFRVWFRPASGGEHRVHAELERWGGGVQLVDAAVPATGPAVPEPVAGGPGERDAGGMTARIEASDLVAGEPSVLAAEFGDGAPVRDLQPWLGMAGHLITAGPDGTLGHVHAMAGASAVTPDETVAAGGPRVEFVYTFATPGRHRLWFQVERDYRVVTVPVEVDVAASEDGS
ncbi:hypothetical protein FHX44_115551 [Pseudonocardia hierapolitana]|uniref:Secreted protein n=1 Tax=Pseudonocardia hierapolitana TaxID=1128676 RepID=A0A561SXM6_9PSEU|nr:hypothetical protein [Pseudonocardia hierapolitana]TWF79617.1 hypothetical protein FHX44_115551 [Pseudonocardia hierapolitana]